MVAYWLPANRNAIGGQTLIGSCSITHNLDHCLYLKPSAVSQIVHLYTLNIR